MYDKFEKFTERARKVLSLAQDEAQRFNHNYIGTEHLLLGLVREGDGVAAKVLASLGVELQEVRRRVEFIIGRGDRIVLGEIGLTPRAKKVVELAVDEARRLNHHYIGAEHLLLGLIREGEGIAAGVLESLGINLEAARAATLAALSGVSVSEAARLTQEATTGATGSVIAGSGNVGPRPVSRQGNACQTVLLASSLLLLGVGVTHMANGIAYGLPGGVGLTIALATAILGTFCVVQVLGMLLALRDHIAGYVLIGLTALAWVALMTLERTRVIGPVAAYRDTMLAQSLNWSVLGLGASVVIMTIALSVFGSARHSSGNR
jgi:hypothetical protein